MKIIDSIEEQVRTTVENWDAGRTDFGYINLNLIRMDTGMNYHDAYTTEVQNELKSAINKVCKKYGVKYNKKRNWIERVN